MTTALKDKLKNAPKIPYRVFTKEDWDVSKEFFKALNEADYDYRLNFWKGTIPAAQKRIEKIKKGGYVVSKPSDWCTGMLDTQGNGVMIYSPRTDLSLKDSLDSRMIGSLRLWEEGGLQSEPLSVYYHPEHGLKQLYSAIDFRKYLLQNQIPFYESDPNLLILERKVDNLERELRDTNNVIDILSKIKLANAKKK